MDRQVIKGGNTTGLLGVQLPICMSEVRGSLHVAIWADCTMPTRETLSKSIPEVTLICGISRIATHIWQLGALRG